MPMPANSPHTPADHAAPASGPPSIDVARLLSLANADFGKGVDADVRGKRITDCDVLMSGAYGPAARRLLQLALEEERAGPIDKARMEALAARAFAQRADLNLAGQPLTDYSVLLAEPHGFGSVLLALVNLTLAQRAAITGSGAPS